MNNNEVAHEFKLNSGPKAGVYKLKGKHQRWLTEQNDLTFEQKLHKVLVDRVAFIGSRTKFDEQFFVNMLDCDLSKLLVELRQHSMRHEKEFSFKYKYKSEKTKRWEEHLHTEELLNGVFPSKPVRIDNPDYDPEVEGSNPIIDANYTEYDEVLKNKNVFIVLPECKQKVRFTMLDGVATARAKHIKKSDRSSHSVLKLRNPVYFHQKEGGKETPIQLNLDNLDYYDIEYLREMIEAYEGDVHTTVTFDHPEKELKAPNERYAEENVLGNLSFFFPSRAK